MKTFTEIINSVIASISSAVAARVDVRIGTVLRDAILAPLSSVMADIYTFISNSSKDQSVSTYTSSAALDAIAANFGLSRSTGTPATGVVRFYVMRRPASAIVIPFGTKVYATSVTPTVTFTTTRTVQIEPITSAVFNQEANTNSPFYKYYYVEAEVICSDNGTAGNLSAGNLSSLDIQTVDGVDNPTETLNGTDALTDAQLSALISSTARGNIGTVYGYKSLVDGNFSFRDSVVIPYDDPEATRTSSASAVDVVILSTSATTITENFAYSAVITPSRQPVQSVSSVAVNGNAVAYTVNFDTLSSFAGSQNARTTISVPGAYNANDLVTVVYKYNPDVDSVQSFFDLPINKVLGSDVLVKQATIIPVGICMFITVLPGYSLDTVKPLIKTAIETMFSGMVLGSDVQKSDIIDVVYTVPGVDSVNTTSFEFRVNSNGTWGASQESVTALKRHVVSLSISSITNSSDIYINEEAPWQ